MSATPAPEELVIRPSMKLVRALYTLVIILVIVFFFVYNNLEFENKPNWPLLLPLVLLIWPMRHHLSKRFIVYRITRDAMRREAGLLSRTIETLQLNKVQNVKVDQSLLQRMTDVGTLTISTAADHAPLLMRDIDSPQAVSSRIMQLANDSGSSGGRRGEPGRRRGM
jgi:uncharacterized membrane protein YdbT with pleckstrin-like domain